ncbi:hypothetical protein WN943_014743 [Citrus x changshan-huyou]
MTESWNAWLGEMRKTPIIALIEHVRKQMMKAIIERKQTCLKWPSDVLVFINKKMNNVLKVGKNYHVIPANDALYEVKTGQASYIVNLDEHTCSCGQWQISGLLCKHAMPCIAHIRVTYEKPPGRPKTCRRREADESLAHRRRFTKHCKNLIAASSSGASFTGVNVVGNSTPGRSIAEPSLNASTHIPKQSTRGSTTKKTPATEESVATNEAIRISRAKKRRRNASTARNTSFDQFSVPLIRGIEIREGGKFDGATLQSTPIQIKRDLKGKIVAQIGLKASSYHLLHRASRWWWTSGCGVARHCEGVGDGIEQRLTIRFSGAGSGDMKFIVKDWGENVEKIS